MAKRIIYIFLNLFILQLKKGNPNNSFYLKKISRLAMTWIPNGYRVDVIINTNEPDDTIDACFEVLQLNVDATEETV